MQKDLREDEEGQVYNASGQVGESERRMERERERVVYMLYVP